GSEPYLHSIGVRGEVTHRDAILITYGDQFRAPGEAPLRTLAGFAQRHLDGLISAIHILPFYPYSSDDGFSVSDYRAVDPQADLSRVVRPRALPLLTRFDTPSGPRHVWTTFSADQVDLNYANPDVLLEIVDLLLFYVSKGAQFIRLDAIAYLWKQIGTPCLHLPQTHRVIQLLRAVLDEVAPHVALITETNVPHADNIFYFGDGSDEAQMVYNFALPPLVLHAFHTGDARILSRWAADLTRPDGFREAPRSEAERAKPVGSSRTTFFNFLASHDGVGLNPARGILPDAGIDALVERALAHGGFVSMKNNPDGARSPYELNVNYFDALSDPCEGSEPSQGLAVDRFMCAQAIMLALAGVPGIYVHSLLGSRGWPDGVQQTGRYRAINRQKFELASLEAELDDATSLRSKVFNRYAALLRARASHAAFDPYGNQSVIEAGASVFALLRTARTRGESVVCLHNVAAQPRPVDIKLDASGHVASDLLSGRIFRVASGGQLRLQLDPYQVLWLNVIEQFMA
ncbi:MAG TPA: sugar phosphorylase, partial [Anaerolineae bacterium]|nr:sugar phosphorylase [Anaerolineae bacterium]